MSTWPVPSDEALQKLYASFEDGIDPALRRMRGDTPASAWYERAARRAARAAALKRNDTFNWLDIGAGAGEIGEMINRAFPGARGTSVDWHNRPAALAAGVRHSWVACDLNAKGFAAAIGEQADLVIAISVWEHVRQPLQFARELLALVKPGGTLYLVCPDYGSAASRLLKRGWPFWIPGEHLNVPTQRGARLCIERAASKNEIRGTTFVRSVAVPYPLAYVYSYLGMPKLARWLRLIPAVPLPVGALEAGLTRPSNG
jgi:SAM-dependent methyltransferase